MNRAMTFVSLHPMTRLLLWCDCVVAAFLLPLPVVSIALPVAWFSIGAQNRRRWLALAWRSRWLMLAIVMAISLAVPGEYLLPGYPGTHEGVAAALDQISRLLVTLAAVAWLLGAPREELVAAFYGLGEALGGGRVADVLERFALRVMLVFELVENRRIHWADLLAPEAMESGTAEQAVTLRPFAPRDRRINLAGMAALVAIVIWAGQ